MQAHEDIRREVTGAPINLVSVAGSGNVFVVTLVKARYLKTIKLRRTHD